MKRFGWVWGFLLGLGLAGGLAAPGSGESPTRELLVQLRGVTVQPRDGGLAVQIKTSGPAMSYETSLIDAPTRLVIDLESTGYGWRKTPLTVGMDPLRQIRGGQFRKGVSRVVLELTRKVGYRIEEGPEGLTVMLEPPSEPGASGKAAGKPAEVAKAEPPVQGAKPADAMPRVEPATPEPRAPEAKAKAPKAAEPRVGAKAKPQPAQTVKESETPKVERVKPVAAAPKEKAASQPIVATASPPTRPVMAPGPVRVAQATQTPAAPTGSRLISPDFKDAELSAAGGLARAAQETYRIGPGDVLAVAVWDNRDLDQRVFVRPDGKISLPLLGEVKAGGLTVAELTEKLVERYGKTVKGAQVMVDVQDIRSRPAFFLGGVGRPGPLQLTQDLTLLQAISVAGGLLPTADLESASILRGERFIPVDFVKLIQKGDNTQNIKLEPGDTIVVPVADVVYVQGEVKNPGALKFSKDLTMVKAIAQAGGFTPLAAPKRVTLLRGEGVKKENMRVNVNAMIAEPESAPDMPLKPNDIIIVPQRLF